ncbi:hypothetical protein [Actinomadura soli]|nr:hypothetical protein [Actinomadura soli]
MSGPRAAVAPAPLNAATTGTGELIEDAVRPAPPLGEQAVRPFAR